MYCINKKTKPIKWKELDDQVCSACPVTRIHRFIDGMGGGTDETEQ